MLVAGRGVAGGRVYGDWMGLGRTSLYQGRDLPVTTDFRDLFHEVACAALELPPSTPLFPGHRVASVGVMRRA
jgi:uncharacterized protein (DUF1501 family)